MKKIVKYSYIVLGFISLALGVLGIFLPILPTTPFLLLSAFLFCKSSKKLHDWLLSRKVLGEYIHNYKTYHAMKRKVKITSIVLLWITLAISFYLVDILYVRIILVVVGIGVTTHLLMIRSMEKVKK